MTEGIIIKALSGFYYVQTGDGVLACKARGRFRLDGTSPLVGDRVLCSVEMDGSGRIDQVKDRKNWFVRPAVANLDAMVFIASLANPVTDPFLIARVSVIAQDAGCELIVCVNKTDLAPADPLSSIFERAGFPVCAVSAETGEGMDLLWELIRGKECAFTGNSGVGKSSLLNRLLPELELKTGEVSDKLGRGKHTTRHVEFFAMGEETYVADTPGFASFDVEMMKIIPKEDLQYDFIDFAPYLGSCRFQDCMHRKEPGCAVRDAMKRGEIAESRYRSYERLFDLSAQHKSWEFKD